jgi:hypothetical protein
MPLYFRTCINATSRPFSSFAKCFNVKSSNRRLVGTVTCSARIPCSTGATLLLFDQLLQFARSLARLAVRFFHGVVGVDAHVTKSWTSDTVHTRYRLLGAFPSRPYQGLPAVQNVQRRRPVYAQLTHIVIQKRELRNTIVILGRCNVATTGSSKSFKVRHTVILCQLFLGQGTPLQCCEALRPLKAFPDSTK